VLNKYEPEQRAGMEEYLTEAPCSLLVFFDDGKIGAVNETLARLLGYTREDLVGQPVDSLLTAASRIFYQTHLFPLLKLHGKAEEIFLSLRNASGDEVPVLVEAVSEEREGVSLNQCAMLPFHRRRKYEDEILQARRAAEEALRNNEELNRTRGELEGYAQALDRKLMVLERGKQELARVSQMLSHDLREPVRKITWFADLLAEEGLDELGQSAAEWLAKIRAACHRADGLLYALHEFVALEIADEPVEAVDLSELIKPRLVEPAELWRDGELLIEGEGLPVVPGVRGQLRQLFRRLLESLLRAVPHLAMPRVHMSTVTVEQNSFRATPEKYKYEPFARITIEANCELVADIAGDPFDPLEALRRNDPDAGFGLAICGKIVANHNGTISATSRRGGGTAITILLPLNGPADGGGLERGASASRPHTAQ
jgi:sigma-B regulation protein RsbU (phosphoserine phosphatase)